MHRDTRIFSQGYLLLCYCPYVFFIFVFTDDEPLNLVLVRWFEAHPDAWDRDRMCRPLCPGPLRETHCLWRYAISPRPRRVMTSPDGSQSRCFMDHKYMFGRTDDVIDNVWRDEQYAYYGLIPPSSILETVSMSREYDAETMSHTNSWLQTVTVV